MGEVVQLRKAAVPIWGPTLKVSAVLFILTKVAGIAYGFFYGVFSVPQLDALLQTVHVTPSLAFDMQVLETTFPPLGFALISALAPLTGWWVYSKVETGGQAGVMWASSAVTAVASLVLSIAFAGGTAVPPVALGLGLAIMVLYTVFFMGLGFIPAQLFKTKL